MSGDFAFFTLSRTLPVLVEFCRAWANMKPLSDGRGIVYFLS